jgi:hypothetical protein
LTYQIPPPNSQAEPATIVLSFLSPITPTSTFRQSLPAAYLSVRVEGTFNISVYVDLNGQWVSGDRQSPIVWRYIERQKTSSSVGLKTWRVKKKSEALFTQWGDRAEWGTLYFSASQVCIPFFTCSSNSLGRRSPMWNFCSPETRILRKWLLAKPCRWRVPSNHGGRAGFCIFKDLCIRKCITHALFTIQAECRLHHCTRPGPYCPVCFCPRVDFDASALEIVVSK